MNLGLSNSLGAAPIPKRDTKAGFGYAKWVTGFNQPFEIKPSWTSSSGTTAILNIKNAAGTSVTSIQNNGSLSVMSASSGSNFAGTLVLGSGTGTLTGLGAGTQLEIKTSANSTQTALLPFNDTTGTSAAVAIGFGLINAGGSARKESGRITIGKVGAYTAGNENGYMAFSTSSSGVLGEVFRVYDTGGFSIGNTTDPGSKNLSVTGVVIHGAQSRLKGYTVATLPASPVQGDLVFATDLLTPTFLTIAVGGGAVVGPVFYNGTNWISI